MQLKQGINVAGALIIAILEKRIARNFESKEELEAVVSVACNYDAKLAGVVTEALIGHAGMSENADIKIEPSWTGHN